tara:strand:+ start:6984 stop:7904 length:921 start_codon:yes stop_codon:yes gene_type:complete
MPYYPLSQIETDLYTNGGEYAFKFNEELYKGSYYKTSDGKTYSEKIPNNQSKEIIPVTPTTLIPQLNESIPPQFNSTKAISIVDNSLTDDVSFYDNNSNILYKANTSNYVSNAQPRIVPSSYYPSLTQKQKDNGQLTRYFTKKTNELKYIEIDKLTYDALKNKDKDIAYDLYEPASLTWRIKGDKTEIFNSNRGSALSIEQKSRWPGFPKYFKDKFTQLYIKSSIQENLYTKGGEFKTPNGREYMGLYHIHPENGAMVGATHVKKKHDSLTLINPQISSPITSSQPPPQRPSTPSTGGGGYSGGGY